MEIAIPNSRKPTLVLTRLSSFKSNEEILVNEFIPKLG